MICWGCHSNSVSTGSRLPICSDVKTRKRRNVVGIDMIRNNRIWRVLLLTNVCQLTTGYSITLTRLVWKQYVFLYVKQITYICRMHQSSPKFSEEGGASIVNHLHQQSRVTWSILTTKVNVKNTFTSHIDNKYFWHFCWLPYLYTFLLYENPSFIIASAETEYISTRSWYRNINFLRDRIRRIF